jgi:hypothetical protein
MLDIKDVFIGDNNEENNKFIQIIKNISNKLVGIDFEFNNINNKREIALMQINIYNSDKKIYIINPLLLDKNQMEILKTFLFKNKIIMHGAESLDIPNMFNEILLNDNERIQFLKNYIDTKFLCEYQNILNNYNRKCKIYELLINQKVITQEIYDYLEKNEEQMGPVYKIIIDIKKLKDNENLILYSSYDVYYLGELYMSLLNLKNLEVFMDFVRLIILIRYNNNLEKYSSLVNSMNNYIDGSSKKRLNDIYLEKLKKNNIPDFLKLLLQIPFIKKFIEIIIKYQIYKNITDTNIVFIKKDVIFNKLDKIETIITEFKYFPNIYKYI